MFSIDPADPTPIEAQLARSIRAAVEAGVLSGGEAMPTVRGLAVQLRANANAVERAYAELARAGVLEIRSGHAYVRERATGTDRGAALAALAELEDELLRRASELGFSLDEVIIHLDSRRNR